MLKKSDLCSVFSDITWPAIATVDIHSSWGCKVIRLHEHTAKWFTAESEIVQLPMLLARSQPGSGTSFHGRLSLWETLKVVQVSWLPPATRHWHMHKHIMQRMHRQNAADYMLLLLCPQSDAFTDSHTCTSVCVCVCYRSKAGSSNSFEALGCHEQLDPKDNQDSEDPREYCYGALNSLHHLHMYSLTAANVSKPL